MYYRVAANFYKVLIGAGIIQNARMFINLSCTILFKINLIFVNIECVENITYMYLHLFAHGSLWYLLIIV